MATSGGRNGVVVAEGEKGKGGARNKLDAGVAVGWWREQAGGRGRTREPYGCSNREESTRGSPREEQRRFWPMVRKTKTSACS